MNFFQENWKFASSIDCRFSFYVPRLVFNDFFVKNISMTSIIHHFLKWKKNWKENEQRYLKIERRSERESLKVRAKESEVLPAVLTPIFAQTRYQITY